MFCYWAKNIYKKGESGKTMDGFLDIKRDSKGTYYSIINYLRLTDKEDFREKIFKESLAAIPILLFCLNKN